MEFLSPSSQALYLMTYIIMLINPKHTGLNCIYRISIFHEMFWILNS